MGSPWTIKTIQYNTTICRSDMFYSLLGTSQKKEVMWNIDICQMTYPTSL